jgi:hypothetical protein
MSCIQIHVNNEYTENEILRIKQVGKTKYFVLVYPTEERTEEDDEELGDQVAQFMVFDYSKKLNLVEFTVQIQTRLLQDGCYPIPTNYDEFNETRLYKYVDFSIVSQETFWVDPEPISFYYDSKVPLTPKMNEMREWENVKREIREMWYLE